MPIDPRHLAPVGLRAAAKLIDVVVAAGAWLGFRRLLGDVPAYALMTGWLLTADWSGSWGKRLLKIAVRDAQTGFEITLVQSLRRNAFLLPSVTRGSLALAVSGSVSGFRQEQPVLYATLGLVAAAWLAYEVSVLSRSGNGRRPGDAWAGTQVVRLAPRP